MKRLCPLVLLFALTTLTAGCTGSNASSSDEPVTVEGRVTVRGNEPFTAYLLQTDSRNAYVLVFEEGPDAPQAPARLRVTGALYLADWNGQSYTHLRVQTWEDVTG